MPAGLIASVIEAIQNGPEGGDVASLTMAGVDPTNPSIIYEGTNFDFNERALQYWPETITDTMEIGWSFREVGGASHALAQWASNGGRTISFDVRLSRYMMPVRTRSDIEKIKAGFEAPDSVNPRDNRPYNVDIAEFIRFLRGFCYPTYAEEEKLVNAYPPPVMILDIPNLGLNESGGDTIFCIMTGCDVTYNLLFRDGTPRSATVALTLRQIVQSGSNVKFKGFGSVESVGSYNMTGGAEGLDPNAGRPLNKIKIGGVN